MLYFFGFAGIHDQVLRFAPKHVENLIGIDLAFVFTALVQTGDLAKSQRLAPRCLCGIRDAKYVAMKLWLTECLQNYYEKVCQANAAAELSMPSMR
jgi:hypothetical protein